MTRKHLISLLSSMAVVAGAPALHAAPRAAVIAPSALPTAERAALERLVKGERRRHPRAFAAVAALRDSLKDGPAHERGRMQSLIGPLRALRAAALAPMLAELALEARPRGALGDWAWRGWRVSLLEAVGSLRDPRAAAVLRAIANSDEPDLAVIEAAARALARLGNDRVVEALSKMLATTRGARRLSIVTALGECRRAAVARALAATLRRAGADRELSRTVVRALGRLGNAWAWRTPAVARSGDGAVARLTAIDALIDGYPSMDDELRESAARALLLISHPQTRARIAAARSRLPPTPAATLAQLDARITRDGLLR